MVEARNGDSGRPEGGLPDPSEIETVTVAFPSGGLQPTLVDKAAGQDDPAGSGGRDKRRPALMCSGAAAVVVAGVAGILITSGGGSGSDAGKVERQGTEIGAPQNVAGFRSGDSLGVATPDQGSGAGAGVRGGAPAGTQTVPSSPDTTPSRSAPSGGTSTSAPSNAGPTTAPGVTTAPSTPVTAPGSAPSSAPGSAPGTPPAAAAPAPAYGGRLGAAEIASSSAAATSLTLPAGAGSADGDTLLVSVMLTNTHAGAVGASDSAGNSYSVLADQSDGAGDRTLILGAVNAKALRSGGSVTLTFPATAERHAALDAFHGVTKVTGHSSATAASGSFASGAAPTGAASSVVFGVAGVQGGSAVAWSSGFTALPTLVVAPSDQLATAYRIVGSGSYQAAGSCSHQWMAEVVTLA